jgi:hypothetical protein
MERETIAQCCQCQQPISPGQDFVSFKVPGGDTYQFFHRRFRTGDCWDRASSNLNETLAGFPKAGLGSSRPDRSPGR